MTGGAVYLPSHLFLQLLPIPSFPIINLLPIFPTVSLILRFYKFRFPRCSFLYSPYSHVYSNSPFPTWSLCPTKWTSSSHLVLFIFHLLLFCHFCFRLQIGQTFVIQRQKQPHCTVSIQEGISSSYAAAFYIPYSRIFKLLNSSPSFLISNSASFSTPLHLWSESLPFPISSHPPLLS